MSGNLDPEHFAAAVPQTPSIPALATKLDALDLANAGSPSLLATAATAPSHFGVIRTQKARSAGNAVATLLDSDHHRPTQRKRVSTLKTELDWKAPAGSVVKPPTRFVAPPLPPPDAATQARIAVMLERGRKYIAKIAIKQAAQRVKDEESGDLAMMCPFFKMD